MSRELLSYADLEETSTSSPGRGRGRGRGGGRGGGGGSAADDHRRKKRKFTESKEHDRVHWDAQGQRAHGDIAINYDSESTPPTATIQAQVMLTDDAAWDDADLIEAWDAAMEEYRVSRSLTMFLVGCLADASLRL